MASMNYCFTVCRAADEKVQQETHPNTASVDIPTPASPGVNIFGRFFAFGSTPPASTTQLSNPFTIRASSFTDIDEDLY
jgi:hypothetical protein